MGFPSIIMYIINVAKTIKKMPVKEFKDFIFERYDHRMGFAKENIIQ